MRAANSFRLNHSSIRAMRRLEGCCGHVDLSSRRVRLGMHPEAVGALSIRYSTPLSTFKLMLRAVTWKARSNRMSIV
jgi:hypothetical protein